MGEKWPVSLAFDSDFHVNNGFFYMPQICGLGHGFTPSPKEGML
jgi:hypothetical protein